MVRAIGLCGLIGAGKDTATEYLSAKYGFEVVSFRSIIEEMMKKIGMETTRENMQKFSSEMRRKKGQDVFAREVANKIKLLKGRIIVIKEPRTEGDVLTIRKKLGKDFILLEIFADEKKRFERMKRRSRLGDPKTLEEFLKQQKREENIKYTGAMKFADYRIDNSRSVEELYRQLDKIILKLVK